MSELPKAPETSMVYDLNAVRSLAPLVFAYADIFGFSKLRTKALNLGRREIREMDHRSSTIAIKSPNGENVYLLGDHDLPREPKFIVPTGEFQFIQAQVEQDPLLLLRHPMIPRAIPGISYLQELGYKNAGAYATLVDTPKMVQAAQSWQKNKGFANPEAVKGFVDPGQKIKHIIGDLLMTHGGEVDRNKRVLYIARDIEETVQGILDIAVDFNNPVKDALRYLVIACYGRNKHQLGDLKLTTHFYGIHFLPLPDWKKESLQELHDSMKAIETQIASLEPLRRDPLSDEHFTAESF